MLREKQTLEVGNVVEWEISPTPTLPEVEGAQTVDKIPWWIICLVIFVIFFYNQGKVVITNTDDGRADTIYQLADNRPPEIIEFRPRNKEQQLQVDYVKHWLPVARIESVKCNAPVSILLGQGIVESKSGTSKVCERTNNHFGVMDGNQYREYDTAWDSWRDHTKVLCGKLYKGLHGKDYKAWAVGLQEQGYADDTHYADTLINVIEQWGLQRYDSPQPPKGGVTDGRSLAGN